MTLARSLALTAAFALATPLAAQTPAETPALAPSEIVAAAPPSDWVAIDPADLLVMDLAPDARGRARRVIIQLMPPPFSQGWIGNIRTLAAAHWWDGTSINRVQDNYVVQWGDATEAKPLPEGLLALQDGERLERDGDYIAYMSTNTFHCDPQVEDSGTCFDFRPEITRSRSFDSYSDATGFIAGWPVAGCFLSDPNQQDSVSVCNGRIPVAMRRTAVGSIGRSINPFWPVHCYGMVGVGRNLSPDTGSGAELYTVIGHAPRHLDRNIALVGRVIEGIEHLSSLPRGTEALGFYATAEERVPIVSVRIATDLPMAEQPRFHYLSTDGATFARYADARANRRDPFFNVPAGGADICNIPVPVRRVPVG